MARLAGHYVERDHVNYYLQRGLIDVPENLLDQVFPGLNETVIAINEKSKEWAAEQTCRPQQTAQPRGKNGRVTRTKRSDPYVGVRSFCKVLFYLRKVLLQDAPLLKGNIRIILSS